MWERIKQFFLDSETIFFARLQAFTGFLLAVLAAVDWMPMLSLIQREGITRDQVIALAVFLLIQGLVIELLRRRRDPELKKGTAK